MYLFSFLHYKVNSLRLHFPPTPQHADMHEQSMNHISLKIALDVMQSYPLRRTCLVHTHIHPPPHSSPHQQKAANLNMSSCSYTNLFYHRIKELGRVTLRLGNNATYCLPPTGMCTVCFYRGCSMCQVASAGQVGSHESSETPSRVGIKGGKKEEEGSGR